MTADAIVVAAGSSSRMGGVDKVLVPLGGRPLLAWSLDALRASSSVGRLIVVVRPERAAELRSAAWVRATDAEVIAGATRRQESVAAGVRAATADVVLVHDGARPLVSPALVDRVCRAAAEHGAAIPLLPVTETLKRVRDGRVVETVDRAYIAVAQTPQGIRRRLLLDAYERFDPAGEREFTDEAALLEAVGAPVAVVEGDPANLKVTVPDDLERAEALLRGAGRTRVGHGLDRHPFGPDDGLALGGITIPEAPRLHGHSDGDAALHAIADAIAGVCGLGDLGRLFPAGEEATRGISSLVLLGDVVLRARTGGWTPIAVDLTITGARPRLGAERLERMRGAIAGVVGLDVSAVAVKASSGNLSGDEGAGLAIAASALVTLVRRPASDRTMVA